jgi:hypothetical protein
MDKETTEFGEMWRLSKKIEGNEAFDVIILEVNCMYTFTWF